MSVDSFRAIHGRLDRLKEYVRNIPANAGSVVDVVKRNMQAGWDVFPEGRWYDHIVADLEIYLPETIDQELRNVELYSSKMVDPYAKHIIYEVSGILEELKSFRVAKGSAKQTTLDQRYNEYLVRP